LRAPDATPLASSTQSATADLLQKGFMSSVPCAVL
jgi:hypothetical protein